MPEWIRYLERFMNVLTPVAFVVVFLVQLKIISMLRSHTSLIMFYGKQIEELRKMASGGTQARKLPDISPDEPGLYEVLRDQ